MANLMPPIFKNIVLNNPLALPHQVRVGHAMPSSSRPFPGRAWHRLPHNLTILGLWDTSKRKQITQAHLIASSAAADKFLGNYARLLQRFPELIQQFQLDDNVQIPSARTPFMRELFNKTFISRGRTISRLMMNQKTVFDQRNFSSHEV